MREYYPAQICLNGHVISSHLDNVADFCEKCGAKTISTCFQCNAPIRGKINDSYAYLCEYVRPDYCPCCGSPYPWTASALQAIQEIINEDDDLFDDEKEKICNSLPDLIAETPRTNLAVVRVKKAAIRAGPLIADALKQFLISFGCELAKRQLGI